MADALRRSLSFALAALVSVASAQPGHGTHAAWKWERIITPNASFPSAEQCAVLDAAFFADAAPGLRDVRLLQDGREIAYATDISLDDRSPGAIASGEDRALYETALAVPANQSQWPGTAGGGYSQRPNYPPGWFYGHAILPAHVPVERIRLDRPFAGAESLSLRAAEVTRLPDAETAEAALTPQHPALAFTIGANLQGAADVMLGVHGDSTSVSSFVLEMRRREICYQPLSKSPVRLLFGNPKAPPVHYDFGRNFKPKVTPLLARMGPTAANPAFREASMEKAGWSRRAKLETAILCCSVALWLTLRPLLRWKR